MKRTQKTKHALVASVVSMAMCCALLLGTTFAWFTDSVTNTGNKIEAGTLDIQLNDSNESGTALFSSDEAFKWEPGRSQMAPVKLSNVGSLWLKYKMSFTNVSTTGDADITNVLDVYKVPAKENGAEATVEDLTQENYLGTVKELMAGTIGQEGILAPNGESGTVENQEIDSTDAFTLVIKMQESAGNEYQNTSVTFDIVANATQYTYETDGFGNKDYDANAGYDNEMFFNGFSEGTGDWSDGAKVENGELIPAAGIYSWYDNYANKNVRISDTWTASVDIHIDSSVDGSLFEISNAVNRKTAEADGNLHLRDFVLRIQKIDDQQYGIAMSNNANPNMAADITAYGGYVGTVAPGWYTMKWEYSVGEDQPLTCQMSLIDRTTGQTAVSTTLSSSTDTNDVVGFNHYLWVYSVNDFAPFHMDNQVLNVTDTKETTTTKVDGIEDFGELSVNTSTGTPLNEYLCHGGSYALTQDVTISNTVYFLADTVIDLQGHTLKKDFGGNLCALAENVTVEFTNGTVEVLPTAKEGVVNYGDFWYQVNYYNYDQTVNLNFDGVTVRVPEDDEFAALKGYARTSEGSVTLNVKGAAFVGGAVETFKENDRVERNYTDCTWNGNPYSG